MNYFPDVSDYDMSSCNGRSLYLAHCDFDPLKGLIAQTKISMQATIEYFGQLGNESTQWGDMQSECEAYETQGIFSTRVVPLAYNSVLLIMVSLLEEALNTWCRMYQLADNSRPELNDFHSRGGVLEKAADYLKRYARIDGIKQDTAWEHVTAIRDARNMIVHNGGRVKEDFRDKFARFGIGMREEDHSVYMDYDTLLNMYNVIIEFADRVFLIKPIED